MRWVKMPIDFPRYPEYRALPEGTRSTYLCLFLHAVRSPASQRGMVLDGNGRPPSIRAIADWAEEPRSTIHRHVGALRRGGQIQGTIGGGILVPLVHTVEQRTRSRQPAADEAVENPGRSGRQVSHQRDGTVPPVGQPLLIGSEDLERDVRSVARDAVVENPPGLTLVWSDLAPSEIEDPDIRHLLGSLAQKAEPWRRALRSARDRQNLVELASDAGPGMLEALRQQSLAPNARNPLAWLNTIVRTLKVAR